MIKHPIINKRYSLHHDNPFKTNYVTVLDIKNGFVQYSFTFENIDTNPIESCSIESFNNSYICIDNIDDVKDTEYNKSIFQLLLEYIRN